jgi:hypothetical protein
VNPSRNLHQITQYTRISELLRRLPFPGISAKCPSNYGASPTLCVPWLLRVAQVFFIKKCDPMAAALQPACKSRSRPGAQRWR